MLVLLVQPKWCQLALQTALFHRRQGQDDSSNFNSLDLIPKRDPERHNNTASMGRIECRPDAARLMGWNSTAQSHEGLWLDNVAAPAISKGTSIAGAICNYFAFGTDILPT